MPTDYRHFSGLDSESGAESGAQDALAAILAAFTPEQRERLAELLNASP